MAAELGFPQMANVLMLGALIGAARMVEMATIEKALAEHLGAHDRHTLEANRQALWRGAEFAQEAIMA
ncbi:MAG: 2-oxoacid:acceptor oxidoreductase family protein [Chloroflexi bacterium]|nr:2-oxoacid:acceptor oxidoreductase family protein [Chloroflexota bacterium]MBI3733918.1 2-oxoacid:acceptor oxidoreductase family protein [Chloroflexota bacterium]